ncbi:MAG TPA: ATP-binding protein, partial [Actinomycetota bacterium]|nr:ATP-binding protein [Actinomycetota bacterium]
LRKSFPADCTSLFPVRQFVRDSAVGVDLRPQELDDIVLAVSDACAVLLRHSLDTVIVLSWEAGREEILITVEDRGEIRVWAEESRIDEDEISLISDLVDDVDVTTAPDTGRTLIRMQKHFGTTERP